MNANHRIATRAPPARAIATTPNTMVIIFPARPVLLLDLPSGSTMDPRDRAAAKEKKEQTKALLDRAFDKLVGSQVSALKSAKSKSHTEEDEERYRATLAAEREAASNRKRKALSAEHEELARTTGLSGQVVALMAKGGGGDEGSSKSDDGDRRRSSSKKRDRKSRGKKSSKAKKHRKSRKSSGKKRGGSSSSKRRRSRSYSSDSRRYSDYSSYSNSSDSDSYSSDYRSSDRDSRKRPKKHKKSKRKHKKDRKREKKRDRGDDRNDDKGKKRKKKDADEVATGNGCGNLTNQFGRYGIIRESDFTGNNERVRRSFEIWLAEIKGISSFTGPKWELMQYYKDYMEDYNTATLPHVKYYDYDKWEMEDYARRKKEAEEAAVGGGSKARSDEFRHREEMKRKEEEKRRAELELMRATVGAKREEMRSQALLKAELENAYKTGNQEKIKSLKRKLEPEEKR